MPACLRDTAGSASTTVLPATDPIVVTSSLNDSDWFAIGPRMNSSRATGDQPQNKHLVHTGSITRRHPPQTFWWAGVALDFATMIRTPSSTRATTTMRTISALVDTTPWTRGGGTVDQTIDLNFKFVLPSVIMTLSTRSCLPWILRS